MKEFNFINQHSIKTVNAELIKAQRWLEKSFDNKYRLYYRERGQELGRLINVYRNKEQAFKVASKIVNKWYYEHGQERLSEIRKEIEK